MGIDFDKGKIRTEISQESCIKRANEEIVELLKIIFSENECTDDTLLEELRNFSKDDSIRIPYYQVTVFVNKVLKTNISGEPIENSRIEVARQRLFALTESKKFDDDKETGKLIIKLQDHIDLAVHQFASLDSRASSIQKSLEDESKKLNEEMKESKDKLETLKDSVFSQIISIVAIFTGIAFIMFGGVSTLGGISDAAHLSGVAFLRVMAYVSVIGIFVVGAVLLFFKFVLILTNKSVPNDNRIMKIGKTILAILGILAILFGAGSFILDSNLFDNSQKDALEVTSTKSEHSPTISTSQNEASVEVVGENMNSDLNSSN